MSAAHVMQKLMPILARCEIPRLFIEVCGLYIKISDACSVFAENIVCLFVFFHTHIRSHVNSSAKRKWSGSNLEKKYKNHEKMCIEELDISITCIWILSSKTVDGNYIKNYST